YAAYVNENYDTYLLTKMEELIHGEIKIPEDSVKTYYDKNRKLFINPARIRLSSILINSKSLADSIQNMLKSGKRFEVIARKYSIQKMSAENGGDIGLFKKEELQSLGNELFSMEMGEVKGPFIDQGKYLFLKCTAKLEATEKPYQEVESEISKVLKSLEWYSKRTKYAESLKSKISCKIFFNKLTEIKIY
ncbi:MAG: peptidyl-prolyl cis-trans isomerase, partial [Ignavibacteria bacterium]|nr:peptidyl-prolyl cis-trans isomerase [Ignavibacteria bacterium]